MPRQKLDLLNSSSAQWHSPVAHPGFGHQAMRVFRGHSGFLTNTAVKVPFAAPGSGLGRNLSFRILVTGLSTMSLDQLHLVHAKKNDLCGMVPYPFCLAVYVFVQLPIAQSYAADLVAKEDVFRITWIGCNPT
jgi:hypothetical protein